MARQVGCGYLTRTDNLHAKAGNMNAALRKTEGELIAIFDCDHVPTRAFLQLTVGWFQKDPKLALLQTPHHFYSPIPCSGTWRGRATCRGRATSSTARYSAATIFGTRPSFAARARSSAARR